VVEALDGLCERTAALLLGARRGRLVREGLQIAILGKPNVGKSSLFNAIVGSARAIVTDVPGTTRDLITEVVDLDGLRVTLVDTAGRHSTTDIVEAEGVRRSRQAQDVSDLILVVVDGSRPLDGLDREIINETFDSNRLIVINKVDIVTADGDDEGARPGSPEETAKGIPVSATTGAGLDDLRRTICSALDLDVRERPEITNVRHISLVQRAHDALDRARTAARAAGASMSEEFVLADLQDARAAFEEVTGRRAPEDLLAHIFARFCIGK